MPTISNLQYHYVSDEIDLTDGGEDYLIGTTSESGVYFHPLAAHIVITEKSGTITVGALCSIGVNASYNDIAGAALVGSVLDDIAEMGLSSSLKRIPYDTEMRVKVISGAPGGGTLKGKAVIFGFYQ